MIKENMLNALQILHNNLFWIALTTPPISAILAMLFKHTIESLKSKLAGKWHGSCKVTSSKSVDVDITIVPLGNKLYGLAKVKTDSDVNYNFCINEKKYADDYIHITLGSNRALFSSTMSLKLVGSQLSGTMLIPASAAAEPKHKKIVLDKSHKII